MDSYKNIKEGGGLLGKVRKALEGLIGKGDLVFASVSGGRDSMTLLNLLRLISKDIGFKLSCVHINFGLRGKESLRDENFVARQALRLDVPLVSYREDEKRTRKKGEGVQAWARRMRFLRYGQLRKKHAKAKIALAHNMDDQIETFFLRLLRGSGTKGLSGMDALSRGYVLRPMLGISRDEINGHVREKGIDFVEDSTNRETFYLRNWVRKNLVPALERQKRYRNPKARILSLMEQISFENEYLERRSAIAKEKLAPEYGRGFVRFDLNGFRRLPKALRYRVLRDFIKRAGTLRGIELSHIVGVDGLATGKEGSKELSLPRGLVALRQYEKLMLLNGGSKKAGPYSYRINPPCIVDVKEIGKSLGFSVVKSFKKERSAKDLFFDLKKFVGPVELRNFRPGDRILLNPDEGPRKVKNIFIGRKIPKNERLNVPLVVDKERVAGIFGVGVDLRYRVDSKTEKVLKASEI